MIEPRSIPNLNQSLFGSANIWDATKANNKNIADMIIAQRRISSELVKGYKATIKNTIEKTTPKDFGEDCSVGMWLIESDISNIYLIKL